MKRKQKTPRRVRPSEISDADCESQTSNDVCIQGSPDTSPKQPKLGAEAQTDTTPTEPIDTEPTDLVDGVKSSTVRATFKNESESGDMPLILNVFSLSQSQSQGAVKQLVDVQKKDSSFPVTPPCSPPLVQLGPFRATPVIRQNAKYMPTNMNYYGFPRENYGPQITQVYSGESQMQYLYNPIGQTTHNPHRIANGVLPVNGSMNQAEPGRMYEQQAYTEPNNNTVNYYFDSHQNLVTNSGKDPIAHLRDMFTHSNKYLVPKESFVSKGSGLYARFKMQQNAYMMENIPPNVYVTSAGDFAPTPQRNVPVSMYYTDTSQTSVPNTIPSTSVIANQGNTSDVGVGNSYLDNSLYTDKYNTDSGCAAILKGYGRNTVMQDEAQVPITGHPGNWCQAKQPVNSQPAASGPIIMQINGAEQSSGCKPLFPSDPPDFLSPRDVKVRRLKRLLEEQEAAIKKLKTNH